MKTEYRKKYEENDNMKNIIGNDAEYTIKYAVYENKYAEYFYCNMQNMNIPILICRICTTKCRICITICRICNKICKTICRFIAEYAKSM